MADLRKRVEAEGVDKELPAWLQGEVVLCRYLKARNFDVEAALAMLKGTVQWRREMNLDAEYDKWTRTPVYTCLADRPVEDSAALQAIWARRVARVRL